MDYHRSMREREDIIPFETLCNNHNEIVHLLQQFKKTGDSWNIDQAIKLTRHCKKQGQHLENRLRKYRNSIETLGFKRVYKTRDKDWKKETKVKK